MLHVSPNAVEAIEAMTTGTLEAGLRITLNRGDPAGAGLELTLVPAPEETDEVVEEAGAVVFLDAQVSPLLDGKTLDADLNEGAVTFTITS